MLEMISSHSNPLVKRIRSLHQKKGRGETGSFLVEGIHPVGEAIQAGWQLEALVYAPDLLSSDFARQLVADQSQRGLSCVAFTGELFTSIAGKENPQGLLAIVRQQHLALDQLAVEHFRAGIAAVSPQDPGNVGTILRTLDAVGGEALFLLDGGVELYHPSTVRASIGSLFNKPVIQASFKDFVQWSRMHGFHLVGSSAHAGTDYRNFQWGRKPTILLVGNEQKGLSAEHMAACHEIVTLPMKGRISSLNLAVAAGILLYRMMENK